MSTTCEKAFTITVYPYELVACWGFEDFATYPYLDSVNGLPMTVALGPGLFTEQPGIIGKGVGFTPSLNTANEMTTAASEDLAYDERDVTLATWFKVTSVGTNGQYVYLVDLRMYDALSNLLGRVFVVWFLSPIQSAKGVVLNDTESAEIFFPAPTLNAWHFLLAQYSPSTGLLSIKIDDVLVGATAVPIVLGAGFESSLRYGLEGNGASGTNSVVVLDEISVRKGPLNDAQATALYNAGAGVACGTPAP